MKGTLGKVLVAVVLVLLVPFLLGRITAAILERTYPTPELRSAAERCREIGTPTLQCERTLSNAPEETQNLMRSLARARAMTRITLIVIGVYFLILIAVWFVRRRRRLAIVANLST